MSPKNMNNGCNNTWSLFKNIKLLLQQSQRHTLKLDNPIPINEKDLMFEIKNAQIFIALMFQGTYK